MTRPTAGELGRVRAVDVVGVFGYQRVADPGMLDGMYSVVIRDAELADLVVVRDVFHRSSLSNLGDRAQLLANPELLEWSSPPAGQVRTRVAAVVDDAIVGFATGHSGRVHRCSVAALVTRIGHMYGGSGDRTSPSVGLHPLPGRRFPTHDRCPGEL